MIQQMTFDEIMALFDRDAIWAMLKQSWVLTMVVVVLAVVEVVCLVIWIFSFFRLFGHKRPWKTFAILFAVVIVLPFVIALLFLHIVILGSSTILGVPLSTYSLQDLLSLFVNSIKGPLH